MLTAVAVLSIASSSFAGSAIWKESPATGDWNTASNWSPPTVPNGVSDTATFAFSNKTALSLSANTGINGIVFNAGASAFTLTATPAFTFTLGGVGIMNNSGIAQNFVAAVDGAGNRGLIEFFGTSTAGNGKFTNNGGVVRSSGGGGTSFTDSSTAGNGTFINNGGSARYAGGGHTSFTNDSTAGNGNFINNGGMTGYSGGGGTSFFDTSTAGNGTFTNNETLAHKAGGGDIRFFSNSTAGNGTFTNNATATRYAGGGILFLDTSTAGNGTFTGGAIQFVDSSTAGSGTFTNTFLRFSDQSTAGDGAFSNSNDYTIFEVNSAAGNGTFNNNNGGVTFFTGISTAGHAILIANGGGTIQFAGNSHGGTARVKVFGNGILDIRSHHGPGVTIGSIEGNGNVSLGYNNLTVGGNNMSTTFSGVISNGPFAGNGSLTKTGGGRLSLTNANSYTGGTTINLGKLLVNNTSGSGTGSGPVQVNVGKLGGTGTIAGAVTVGTGSGSKAGLSPGDGNQPGTFTIQSTLKFNSDATYKFDLNSSTATADKVVANGVTINSAQFSFADLGSSALSTSTVFTVINNTATTPIAGPFTNLADGSMFTNNGNTYQANYEGGDGNDLTLTVVP